MGLSSVSFEELEPPLVMDNVVKGITVWAYMSLSKSGSLMKDLAGQMPETRCGFKLSFSISTPVHINLIAFMDGIFPLVTGGSGKPLISLGGRPLPVCAAPLCQADSLAVLLRHLLHLGPAMLSLLHSSSSELCSH